VKEDKPALVLHGHFYQPPRENPWTDRIERQAEAHPHHDWNERIHHESYRPNAYARVTDAEGRIDSIVNTYEHLSFNFGPTLLSWLERARPDTLARIQEADRRSQRARGGHGNAIAQAYGHAILPLCNPRDLRTQIRWGLADFRHRFRRHPESMWLPETAVNEDVIDALIDEGLRYIILSPTQAARVRRLDSADWVTVEPGAIDPRRAYACHHRDRSGRFIAVFFYHGGIAHSIAFEGLLHSSAALMERCRAVQAGPGQIVNIATDGETYGHHFPFGERCIAHALTDEAVRRGFWVTNYAEYLEHHPPTHAVELAKGPQGEGTAWSCAHGVGRWTRDCGCQTGGPADWSQAWRGPLREALDYLRDQAAAIFESTRGQYFKDPWEARDAYVSLVLDRSRSRREFLRERSPRELSERDRERALSFLELQRGALLMYTSCGWFFSDLSGIETQQILGYAARVLSLAEELGHGSARKPFLDLLGRARSNRQGVGSAADVFRRLDESLPVSPERVAANLSMVGLVSSEEPPAECAGYRCQRREWRRKQQGRTTLSAGRLILESLATGRTLDFATLSLHLGEADFYAAVKPYPGGASFAAFADRLWSRSVSCPLPSLLRIAQEEFGGKEFGLDHALEDDRQRVIGSVFGSLLRRLAAEYARLYDDHQRALDILRAAGFDLPPELRAVAEISLARRFEDEIRLQSARSDPAAYQRAIEIAQEGARRGCRIDRGAAERIFEERITEAVRVAAQDGSAPSVQTALALHQVCRNLLLSPPLARAQEILFYALQDLAYVSEPLRSLAAALGLSSAVVGAAAARETNPSDSLLTRTT
jgi:alpha-amylase/alpha-mannosidase (GH57 family)